MKKLSAKLTAQQASLLKVDLYRGISQTKLAPKYGISQASISRIVHGSAWSYIPWPDGRTGPADMEAIARARDIRTDDYDLPTVTIPHPQPRIQPQPEETSDGPVEEPATMDPPDLDDVPDSGRRKVRNPLEETGPSIADQIASMAQDIKELDELQMHNAMFDIGESPDVPSREEKTLSIEEQPRVAWDDIIKILPTHPVVLKATIQKQLRLPLQVALYRLSRKLWATSNLDLLIHETARLFDYEIHKLEVLTSNFDEDPEED